MDDNTRTPKPKVEAGEEVKILLSVVRDSKEKYKAKDIVATLIGKENAMLNSHKTPERPFFGIGKNHKADYWMALIRQTFVVDLLKKEIEQYGVLKMTESGHDFIANPRSFMMTADHTYTHTENVGEGVVNSKAQGGISDQKLMGILKDLRKKVAKKKGVPPFAIFQDPSLEAMALRYPITIEELSNVHGVGDGKAKKFGKDFIAVIEAYVNENDIVRPDDLIVKGTGVKSGLKLYIIQNTDRKLSLEDISKSKGLEMDQLIKEIETIVYSGTKLDISYCIDDILDEDQQEEIMEYFMDSETDDIQAAMDEFDGDYEEEDMRLMRIKFLSEVAN